MSIVEVLGIGLGTAWTAGINLYATVAILGLLQRFEVVGRLPGGLDALDNAWLIGLALALYTIEFVADKIPYVDTVWDAAHTFIRVPAGAVLALAAAAELSPAMQIGAFLLGGSLAVSTHGTKATVRAAANASPEPLTNWMLSLAEDIFVVGAAILTVLHPVAILAVITIFLLILVWILPRVVRRLRSSVRAFRSLFRARPPAAPGERAGGDR